MKRPQLTACYLCGELFEAEAATTRDHVVPKVLKTLEQPKVPGFDYGGVLPTHAECNNRFGAESYCSTALDLLAAFEDPDCTCSQRLPDASHVRILLFNQGCAPNATPNDLAYFRIIDLRAMKPVDGTWQLPELPYFQDKPQGDLTLPTKVCLSVLAKSAAALLIAREVRAVPDGWNILGIPYVEKTGLAKFDALFGDTKPFDVGLQVWLKLDDNGMWIAAYRARKVVVFLVFNTTNIDISAEVSRKFSDTSVWHFRGRRLRELLTAGWARV